MSNILDYKVISEQGSEKLINEVKKAIDEGWQPIGGHNVHSIIDRVKGKGVLIYSQSLVKYSV